MQNLNIAIAQINCTVGDLAGNSQRILAAAERAKALGADLLLTPELALCGYPPEDLLLRPDFYRATQRHLAELAGRLCLPTVVGHAHAHGGQRYNCASLLRNGAIETTYRKQRLPNADVLDEERYFSSGEAPCVFEIAGAFGLAPRNVRGLGRAHVLAVFGLVLFVRGGFGSDPGNPTHGRQLFQELVTQSRHDGVLQ